MILLLLLVSFSCRVGESICYEQVKFARGFTLWRHNPCKKCFDPSNPRHSEDCPVRAWVYSNAFSLRERTF